MVPVRKKSGEIRLCVDFINLNQASDKDNYHVPPMEYILHLVSGSQMFSLLDEFSGYNQVLIAEPRPTEDHFQNQVGNICVSKDSLWLD
jgi:hypothetical protein